MKGLSYFFLFSLIFYCSCADYTPKPLGYFRIELDKPEYKTFLDSDGIFLFNVQKMTMIEAVPDTTAGEWFNIVYPSLNAKIYCSFLPVLSPKDLAAISEDSRKFVYKHALKADDILEQAYSSPDNQVHALIYELEGNVATPLHFLITDSTRYCFMGALYFDSVPNQDSIAPVKAYIKDDILEIIGSFRFNGKNKK